MIRSAAIAIVFAMAADCDAYNARNWLTSVNFPEIAGLPSPDQTNTYTKDGLLKTTSNANSSWAYAYNSRRALKQELLTHNAQNYAIDYSFNNLGHLNSLTYPNGFVNAFNPNALGQASQSASFVNGVSYHANRMTAGWTFGNSIQRSITQTQRQLPDRISDTFSATPYFDENPTYDIHGNITAIADGVTAINNRSMSYDAQHRLINAQGVWGGGSYSYDGADNLKTQVLAGKSYQYNYTNQKLTSITDPFFTISFNYDAKGNQTGKLNQVYVWDNANRLARVNARKRNQYDALGHRLLTEKLDTANNPTGESTFSIYTKAGQLIQETVNSNASTETPLFKDGFENVGAIALKHHQPPKPSPQRHTIT